MKIGTSSQPPVERSRQLFEPEFWNIDIVTYLYIRQWRHNIAIASELNGN